MEVTLDAALSHVLDPSQQETAPLTVADVVQQEQHTPTSQQRKKSISTPGSSTDARRREANRLAAERSRGRQHEKIVALEMAVQALGDENLRLKEEIGRLEGRNGVGADSAMVGAEHGLVTSHDSMSADAAATAAAVEAVVAETQAQQDSHSRNILAELLSANVTNLESALAAGLDPEGDGDNWMQGVENLFKEAEASGRLGELAAVAAGQGGEASTAHDQMGSGSEADRARTSSFMPATIAAATSTSAASAIAMSNEMEKLLRDDLAATKAAIAKTERQLARLLGQHVYDNDEEGDTSFANAPPDGVLEADEHTLVARSDHAQSEITRLQGEAKVLHEVVARMHDDHTEEEEKVATLARELRSFEMDGGERERERIGGVLRALRSHVTTLMNGPGGELNTGSLAAPFASPATARRRRGRPPKHGGFQAVKYAYPVYSPSSSDGTAENIESVSETPTARPRAGGPRKSRLAHEIQLSPDPSTPGPSTVVATADNLGVGVSSQAAHAHAHDDYLLSHLTNAADASRASPLPLDGSSFAAFLPQSPAEAAAHAHAVMVDPALTGHSHPTPDHGHTPTDTPNILSRLKRGPPGSCDICGRTETSVWRKLSLNGEDHKVCNACGLYHAKFGVIRPPELWGDGKSVKKRKASARTAGGFESPNGGKRKRKSAKFDYTDDGSGGLGAVAPTGGSGPDMADVGRAVENMFAAGV